MGLTVRRFLYSSSSLGKSLTIETIFEYIITIVLKELFHLVSRIEQQNMSVAYHGLENEDYY